MVRKSSPSREAYAVKAWNEAVCIMNARTSDGKIALGTKSWTGKWFFAFGLLVAADAVVSRILATVEPSLDRAIIFVAEHAVCVFWAWMVAWRLPQGRGRVAGIVLLSVVAWFVGVGLTLLLAIGVAVGEYRPPMVVWLLHGSVLASYLGAWVSIMRSRPRKGVDGLK